jgi:hypothetical protein
MWDVWKKPDGERLTTFTVITTAPNELTASPHESPDRPPRVCSWLTGIGRHRAESQPVPGAMDVNGTASSLGTRSKLTRDSQYNPAKRVIATLLRSSTI